MTQKTPKDRERLTETYKQAFLWDFCVFCYRNSQKASRPIHLVTTALRFYGLSNTGFDVLHSCAIVPSANTRLRWDQILRDTTVAETGKLMKKCASGKDLIQFS